MVTRTEKTNRMSKIIDHNGTVYFSGIVSDNKELDIKGQSVRVLEMCEDRLKLAGLTKENLLKADIYLKNIDENFAPFNEIWDAWVSQENQPTRACVEANMASSNTLVEIVFTSYK